MCKKKAIKTNANNYLFIKIERSKMTCKTCAASAVFCILAACGRTKSIHFTYIERKKKNRQNCRVTVLVVMKCMCRAMRMNKLK